MYSTEYQPFFPHPDLSLQINPLWNFWHISQPADWTNKNVCICAAQDLAQYVNEVKRDNETLREIDQYQRSIENLVNQESFFKTISSC